MGSIKVELELIDNNYNTSEKIRSEKGFTYDGKLFLTYLQNQILMDLSFVVLDVDNDGIHNPSRKNNIDGFDIVLSGDCKFRSKGFSILHLSKETGQCKIILYDGNCKKTKERDLYCDIEKKIVGGIFTPSDHYIVLCYYYEGNNRIDLLDSKSLDTCSSKVINIDLFTQVKTFKLRDNKEYLVVGSYDRKEKSSTVRIFYLSNDEIIPIENCFITLKGKIYDMDLHRDDTILQTLISIGLEIDCSAGGKIQTSRNIDSKSPFDCSVSPKRVLDNHQSSLCETKKNLLCGDERRFELHLVQFYKNDGNISKQSSSGSYSLRSAYKKEMTGNCTTSFHPSGSFLVVCNNINTEINNQKTELTDISNNIEQNVKKSRQTDSKIYLPDIISIYHINTDPYNKDLPCLVIDDIPRFGPSCSKAYFDSDGQYMLIAGSSLLFKISDLPECSMTCIEERNNNRESEVPSDRPLELNESNNILPNYIHNINLYKFKIVERESIDFFEGKEINKKETYADVAKKRDKNLERSHSEDSNFIEKNPEEKIESRELTPSPKPVYRYNNNIKVESTSVSGYGNNNTGTEYEKLRLRRNRPYDRKYGDRDLHYNEKRRYEPNDQKLYNQYRDHDQYMDRDRQGKDNHTLPYPNADRVPYRRPSHNDPFGYGGRDSGYRKTNEVRPKYRNHPEHYGKGYGRDPWHKFKNMKPGPWRDVLSSRKEPVEYEMIDKNDISHDLQNPHRAKKPNGERPKKNEKEPKKNEKEPFEQKRKSGDLFSNIFKEVIGDNAGEIGDL